MHTLSENQTTRKKTNMTTKSRTTTIQQRTTSVITTIPLEEMQIQAAEFHHTYNQMHSNSRPSWKLTHQCLPAGQLCTSGVINFIPCVVFTTGQKRITFLNVLSQKRFVRRQITQICSKNLDPVTTDQHHRIRVTTTTTTTTTHPQGNNSVRRHHLHHARLQIHTTGTTTIALTSHREYRTHIHVVKTINQHNSSRTKIIKTFKQEWQK